MAEAGCSEKDIEKAISEVLLLFKGNKRRAVIKCSNGVKVAIEKKRFGLEFTIE